MASQLCVLLDASTVLDERVSPGTVFWGQDLLKLTRDSDRGLSTRPVQNPAWAPLEG